MSIGHLHISQVINTFEWQRALEAWEYPSSDKVHIKLCDYIRIREIEKTAAINERARASAQAHSLKALGSSADSYTSQEIENTMMNLLLSWRTDNECFLASQNMVMFLLPIASFFWGNNICCALFSDMFFQDIPSIDHEVYDCQGNHTHKHDIKTLSILVDKGKHNTNGQVNEHGMIGHQIVEFCGVGVLARYFFDMYHIKKKQPPCFEPRFGPKDPAEFGALECYNLVLFPGKDSKSRPPS
ncbi:hypothetical protein V5O48_008143 [Marasmius crinis-equi]|uniref:Uncharacterized protein n=1 Tax=Marasmius crinis-equi TaxID=585013 RepID=A0ABR3FEX5_9AGAR